MTGDRFNADPNLCIPARDHARNARTLDLACCAIDIGFGDGLVQDLRASSLRRHDAGPDDRPLGRRLVAVGAGPGRPYPVPHWDGGTDTVFASWTPP